MSPIDVTNDDEVTLPGVALPQVATTGVALAPYADVDPVPIGDPDDDEGYDDDDEEDDDDDEEPLQCCDRERAFVANRRVRSGRGAQSAF